MLARGMVAEQRLQEGVFGAEVFGAITVARRGCGSSSNLEIQNSGRRGEGGVAAVPAARRSVLWR